MHIFSIIIYISSICILNFYYLCILMKNYKYNKYLHRKIQYQYPVPSLRRAVVLVLIYNLTNEFQKLLGLLSFFRDHIWYSIEGYLINFFSVLWTCLFYLAYYILNSKIYQKNAHSLFFKFKFILNVLW